MYIGEEMWHKKMSLEVASLLHKQVAELSYESIYQSQQVSPAFQNTKLTGLPNMPKHYFLSQMERKEVQAQSHIEMLDEHDMLMLRQISLRKQL